MASLVRRSGRELRANRKYQNDLLEKETLRLLRESSESSRPTSPDTSDSEEVKSDNEFDTSKLDELHVSEDEEDDLSLISGSGRGISEGSEIETPGETDANMSIATSGISEPEDYEGRPRGPGPKGAQRPNADGRSRGLQPTHGNASRETIWESLAGASDQDVIPLLFARDQWKWKRDITFPSRKSLAETATQGVYGNGSRFGVPADDLRYEATTGWDWYEEEIGDRFRRRQRMENTDDKQAHKHITFATKHDTKIVMGPLSCQQAYHLEHLAAMDFGQAWEKGPAPPEKSAAVANPNIANAETSNNVDSGSMSHSARSRYRDGWLLNLGSKIQGLAWAPNRHGHDRQYLAISTSCSPAQRNSVPASSDRRAPAFRPSPQYPSCLQIWAFRCLPATEGLHRLDMTTQPRLVQVLCTCWGNIRQLQWCPVLREPRDLPEQQMSQSESTNLGLLGVATSDGHARVLDVSVPKSVESGPQYLSVKSAAFEAISSSSIYTCLSFVSPTDLLCGTASGSVDLFNILRGTEASDEACLSATPYFTALQSLTYILSLSPAYPSPFTYLLASTSMSGTPVMADLRSTSTDKVYGKNARMASKHLVYSPHLRSYLSTTSEDDAVQAYPIRRFFNGIRVARFTGQGILTALATSRWHPCLLMGTSSGTVSCTNVIRRILPSYKRARGSGAWVQKLCEYQWIPQSLGDAKEKEDIAITKVDFTTAIQNPPPDVADLPSTDKNNPEPPAIQNRPPPPNPKPTISQKKIDPDASFHPPPTRPGTSRFYEGFKATKQDLSATAKMKARGAAKTGTETIYEEEQAVTAAEWNPNLECSAWIALGWGSGIVRVEDVGHEAV